MSIIYENKNKSNSINIDKIIKAGDIAGVRDFIASGLDINQVDTKTGWTPLEIAAHEGQLEIAKILIEAGAIVDKGSSTPLGLAVGNGFTEIVHFLLEAGNYAEKSKNQKFHDTLLMPIAEGYFEIVEALINAGADVNYLWDCGSGLHYALLSCNQKIVEFLLANGADVNIRSPEKDGKKWTPLMEAASRAHGEIARMLIEKGADINAKDTEGKTALIIAAKFGNAEVAGELILAGADIDAKDNNGNTALMYAYICEPDDISEAIPDLEELDKNLSEIGDSLEGKFKRLEKLGNILSNIKVTGRINIAKMLRIAGASQQGLRVIDLVNTAEKGNIAKVENLIKDGVDINGFNSTGHTALIAAVRENHIDIVATLIEAGADINLRQNSDSETALMEAAHKGNIEIVRMLIEAGADVNIHAAYGLTALTRAEYNNNTKIINLLRESGAKKYHEISISQWRGVDTIQLNDNCVIIKASVEEVSQAFCQVRNANIWQKDVLEKEIEMTDICFTVFQLQGHNWTAIRDENITISYDFQNVDIELIKQQWQNKINEKDAKAISEILQTQTIYFSCSDTAGAVNYHLFDCGEIVEEFNYCCDSNFIKEDKKAAENNECVIVSNTFNFRSKFRHITINDIPQYKRNDDEYFDDEPEINIDEFKFVNDFIKSLDAYIPAWGGANDSGAGQRTTLRVIGLDPEDIERMDFIAVS